MKTGSKVVAVGTITAAMVLGAAGAAFAIGQGRAYTYSLSSTGVSVPNGYSQFYASTVNRGGMEYRGTLYDTSKEGNNVYVEAKVEGYGWGGRIYGYKDSSTGKSYDQYMYDPAALYVSSGAVRACRDRGTFGNDNCQATTTMYR